MSDRRDPNLKHLECSRREGPNYMWTGIFIVIAVLLFLIFVKFCKQRQR